MFFCRKNMPKCTEKNWHIFVITDLSVISIGFVLLLLRKLIKNLLNKCFYKKSQSKEDKTESGVEGAYDNKSSQFAVEEKEWIYRLQVLTSKLISGQNVTGIVLIFVACVCTLITVSTYIYEATVYPAEIERCGIFYEETYLLVIDIICYLFFLFYFILRFLAADNKIEFWFGIYSLVDLVTIPCYFVEICLDHLWMGLRFFRAIWLMKIADLFQCIGLVKSATKFRLVQLSTMFICMWIVGSGVTHLLENTGKLTLYNDSSEHVLTFGDYMYFTIVTMSTVGYGDIYPQTTLGKVWIAMFILVSFAIFASFIPEIADIMFSGSEYSGHYAPKDDYKHVVVCGNLEFSSVQSFLADFFNEDRPVIKTDVVFINQIEPSFDMKTILKNNYMRVKFIKGTVMDQTDLKRVSLEMADACFILANHNCKNPKDEDAANIMRVISLKNFSPTLRVLVQLLQYENKSYLRNIPTWNRDRGDTIICYGEVELRILAKSCLIPGYSTFITNLFSIRSEKQCQKFRKPGSSWINEYIYGVGMELYTSNFSAGLIGMAFYDLVLFCYNYLQILLIAAEVKLGEGKTVFVNPSSQSNVTKETLGYFICKSFKEADRAALYCSVCHGTNHETFWKVDKIKCKCSNKKALLYDKGKHASLRNTHQKFQSSLLEKSPKKAEFLLSIFKDFNNCIIRNPLEPVNFSNHILVCIFAESDSPLIDLKNFILPLRSRKLKSHELKKIVIAGNEEYLAKEWSSIGFFSEIYPISFRNINKKSLSILRVERCHVCLILSAKVNNRDTENMDFHLVDKEIILGTLNVKSIFKNSAQSQLLMGTPKTESRYLITKLLVENNVQFLDQDDEDQPNCPVFLSETFACGSAFTTKMLDCLLGIAYFNPHIIKLIHHLIGGEINCLEDIGDDSSSIGNRNMKCHFVIEPLNDDKFQPCFINKTNCLYKDVFAYAFKHYHLIFLGLYRLIDGLQNKSAVNNKKVIITNPESNFCVYTDDLVLVLSPVIQDPLQIENDSSSEPILD